MRADRLLSILLLLQARGPRKLTAGQLAAKLEVSERTISASPTRWPSWG